MMIQNLIIGVYDVLSNNNYNVGRYDSYTFGDATVSAQGQNYIYVFEKGIGLGYQDKGNQKLVSFFTQMKVNQLEYMIIKCLKSSTI